MHNTISERLRERRGLQTHLSAFDFIETAHLAIGVSSEVAVWNMVDYQGWVSTCFIQCAVRLTMADLLMNIMP